MKSRFAPDRGLTGRMLVTTFLLGLLYVVFIAVLLVLLKSAVLAVVLAGGLLFVQYWFSDRIALYAMHGRTVTREQARRQGSSRRYRIDWLGSSADWAGSLDPSTICLSSRPSPK